LPDAWSMRPPASRSIAPNVCAVADDKPNECRWTLHSGADGSFTFRGLAPGRYKLCVLDDFGDPPGANPLEVVELHEGEKTTRDLTSRVGIQ